MLIWRPREGVVFIPNGKELDVNEVYLALIDLLERNFWYEEKDWLTSEIIHDYLNIVLILENYDLVFDRYKEEKHPNPDTVLVFRPCFDYLFTLIRSLFDLYQLVIRALRKKYESRKILPRSFAAMFDEKKKELRAEKYELSENLKVFYENSMDFFFSIRKVRENIIHNKGKDQTALISAYEEGMITKTSLLQEVINCIDELDVEDIKVNTIELIRLDKAMEFIIKEFFEISNLLSEILETEYGIYKKTISNSYRAIIVAHNIKKLKNIIKTSS